MKFLGYPACKNLLKIISISSSKSDDINFALCRLILMALRLYLFGVLDDQCAGKEVNFLCTLVSNLLFPVLIISVSGNFFGIFLE